MSTQKWGPYLSDRQWGTVREDYSADGEAWRYTTHDLARSQAWRWGEEGIGGISDDKQLICCAPAFWNGKDEIIKERLFGLTNSEGNHGEDVKELYYYLDNVPDHSYMRMLYKYPQKKFPYYHLIAENAQRSRQDKEYEILDTGIFNDNQYFDIFIEYTKADDDDILIRITAHNRADNPARLVCMPTVWFRNTWAYGLYYGDKPNLSLTENHLSLQHRIAGEHFFYADGDTKWLFSENETNHPRLYGTRPHINSHKDGINDFIITGSTEHLNHQSSGTKAAAYYDVMIPVNDKMVFQTRLSKNMHTKPFADFNAVFENKKKDADDFYKNIQKNITDEELKLIQRQAFAGMLWSKQYFNYDVSRWLRGDPGQFPPPAERWNGRNSDWQHFNAEDILSMPDKWEYPWFAAWDLAFHTIVLAKIDSEFAKRQLNTLFKDTYQHPNGQLPAYEWNFSDVNPPVHAYAAWKIFDNERKEKNNAGDLVFLEQIFQRLLANYNWWINQKDSDGNDIFSGGFLGLDNIGVFNRSAVLPDGETLEQADATSWVAMFSLNMMRIAIELSKHNILYQDYAVRFFERFLQIAKAASQVGGGLWDEADGFFYDCLRNGDGNTQTLRVRTMVGLVPLFAVEILDDTEIRELPEIKQRIEKFLADNLDLSQLVSHWFTVSDDKRLLSLLRGHRTKSLLHYALDELEFLSPYGIRSVSKFYDKNPYSIDLNGQQLSLKYIPAESDSGMFGGNSNWRGPVWMPMNYLIIDALKKFHTYYGDDFRVEYPANSGQLFSLLEIADKLSDRLVSLFRKDANGSRPIHALNKIYTTDPNFQDLILFYEYFDGDNGRGVGASHQTGWTGLVAGLI